MERNTAVVATEDLPGGGQLQVTENPAYSYILTPNGDKCGKLRWNRCAKSCLVVMFKMIMQWENTCRIYQNKCWYRA